MSSDRILLISEVGSAIERAAASVPQDGISIAGDARTMCNLYGELIAAQVERMPLDKVREPYRSLLQTWLPDDATR